METSCSKFTAAEGGARLAAAAAERNTLAVEYSAFVATRLLHEDAYRIRGLLSKGYQRSVYVTRASKVSCMAYELHILTDLTAVKALKHTDVEDWATELEEKQVIVCTSQVLKWLLQEGMLTIPLLNVLIIDSCHLIFEDQNLQYIMKCYKQYKEYEQPRILALTYPLFTSGKDSELATNSTSNNNFKGNNPETTATSVNETANNCKDGQTDIKVNVDKKIKNENSEFKRNDEEDEKKEKIVELRIIDQAETVSDNMEDKRIIEITDGKENGLYYSSTGKEIEIISSKRQEPSERNEKVIDEIIPDIEKKNDRESLENKYDLENRSEEKTNDITDNIEVCETKDNVTESSAVEIEIDKAKGGSDGKSDDFHENLDDFDMYEKLEWKIEELEQALCCKMDLAEDIDGGKRLANTVAKPKEILIEYSSKAPLDTMPDAYVELESYMRESVASAKAFMDEHRYDPTEIYGDDMYEEFMNIPDPTIEPKLMFNQFLYVLDQLGPYAADKAAFSLLVKLEKLKIKVPYERHFLLLCLCTTVFVKIRCQAELILTKYDDWERIRLFSTPKVLRFAEILEEFQSPEQKEKAADNLNNRMNKEFIETSVIDKKIAGVNDIDRLIDIERDIVPDTSNCETETKLNNIEGNENIENCNEASTTDLNAFEKTRYAEGNNDPNSPKLLNSGESTHNYVENNADGISKGKLVRSKTIELIDELDKCDFVTLSNKIEDRVNTYEANLKELDIDDSHNSMEEVGRCINNEYDTNDGICGNKAINVDGTLITIDNTTIDNVNQIKDNIVSINSNTDNNVDKLIAENRTINESQDDKITTNTDAGTRDNILKVEKSKDESIKDDLKTEGKDTNVTSERQKSLDPPDPRQVLKPMDLKSKALGFRRPHRVRGRGRVHRTHAARLQQMQQNPDALCGIVFVKEPLIAKIIFMIIVDMSRCRPSLSHLCAQYCAVESEGDDCRPRGKKHEDVLKKFRMHECNLLLATSALEEGIDLPRCNLVVRWDTPQSYRSHGLCRSRARASRSSVALMGEAPSEGLLDNLSVYKELDQIISRKCGCGIQNEPPPSEEVYADVFTPIVKAYTPDDVKENIKSNNEKKVKGVSDSGIHQTGITKNNGVAQTHTADVNINYEGLNDNDKTAGVSEVLKADVNNDNYYKSNDKIELTNDVIYEDVEVIVNNIDDPAKEVVSTDRDSEENDKMDKVIDLHAKLDKSDVFKENLIDTDKRMNEALNIGNISANACEINEEINIPISNSNETRDIIINRETNFNITYSFSKKSVCVCKSGMCKCKSVSGSKSEARSKTKVEDENCSVDLSTAIALINRYCGKLPSDTFTRLAPQYWVEVVRLPDKQTGEMRRAYICTLRLPLNCPVKYNIVGHPMPTEVLARRMVALQACRILHKSGELDNQLMPIGKENFKAAELENIGQSDSENNDSARPGTTKRRQYYYKRTASAFTDCQPIIDCTDVEIEQHSWKDVKDSYKARFGPEMARNTLYALSSRLWCALPERYNTRGRRLHAPQHAPHAVAVLMAAKDAHGLHIPAFPVYTRSGEVRVAIERAPHADVRLSPTRVRLVRRFMRFVFSDVLRVRRRGMRLQTEGSTHNNYYIVPTVRATADDGTSNVDIDWQFLELIYKHTEEKKNSVEKPVLLHQDEEEEEEVVERKPKREREKDGKVKKMENPLLKPGEVFVFDADRYRDAVVTPWYRNRDQPQYFLVAEICWNLSPDSAFPSSSHGSFRDYYSGKYGVTLTQPRQPLLDVDHTSARLNLLTPRYVNRKGVALPVSSERTRRAKRDRLDQKQILVPELCAVHPFAAPLWFATVALPCVLYRINALLIADEIRRSVGADVALGAPAAPGAPPPQWPPLDFGWSLAEVLNTDEKGEKSDRKKEDDDSKRGEKEAKQKEGEEKNAEVREKTINDILQEKEDAESGFEIGTWSNDMASSLPTEEYDEYLEPLPPNLTFCTSASGGTNWSDPIEKPKMSFGASRTFSMAESDCSYLSSDFDTDDSDLNSEGTDEETDSSGFFSKNSYASMGVRIEYKTAHEAEAVDLERKARVSSAPQPDPLDDELDVAAQRRILREGQPPAEYIEKYKESVARHKKDIRAANVIGGDKPIKEILPDTTKEMDRLRKCLELKLNNKRDDLNELTDSLIEHHNDSVGTKVDGKTEVTDNKVDIVTEYNGNMIKDNEFNNKNVVINIHPDDIKHNLIIKDQELSLKEEIMADSNIMATQLQDNIQKIVNDNNNIVNEQPLSDINVNCAFNNIAYVDKEKADISITVSTHDTDDTEICSPEDNFNVKTDNKIKGLLNKELLHEMFPYGDSLDIDNGHVSLDSIEKNKRILLEKLKKSLTEEEVKKMNCFSMLDIDIDSPDYVNDKVVNVGFDTKESYLDKVNGFRNPKKYKPYYEDGKVQNGKEFDFDYQPDLEEHPGPSPSVILQALTMSNANDGINLERLETIGDSFLKFAITAYLYCAHPAVHEGKLSHMRSKQVSNLNLYRLGRNKRLGARMIASKFEPHDNWLPPCHRPPPTHHPTTGDQDSHIHKEVATDNTGCFIPYNLITQHSIPDKSIADCVEALIGAYLLEMGPRGALLFMSWLGISVLPRHLLPLTPDHPYVLATAAGKQKPTAAPSPKQSYSSSSISCSTDSEDQSSDDEEGPEELEQSWECEWSWRGRPVGSLRPRMDEHGNWYQTVYGELRAPPSPLLRYVEDPEGELERMLSGYDALERTLQYRFRDRSLLLQALTHASHQQNRLTDCYQRLEFLGDAILDYLITRHLYEDARRHSPGALTDLRSALVNNTIFATLAARHGFHKYFRHMSPGLNEVLTKYVKIQEENGHSISEEHYLIQEDEMEQAEDVEVPKALGDLFESVAGAIFLDSGMSLGAVWASYVRLMGAELEAFSAAAPKSPVRELLEAEPDTAKFGKPERLADGRRVRVCVEVFGRGAFKGIGRNYRIAKGTAARCALRHLRGTRPPRR